MGLGDAVVILILGLCALLGGGLAALEVWIWAHYPEGVVVGSGKRARATLLGAALWTAAGLVSAALLVLYLRYLP